MKLIHIVAVNNGEFPNFYGFTADNECYRYVWKTGSWEQFKKAAK